MKNLKIIILLIAVLVMAGCSGKAAEPEQVIVEEPVEVPAAPEELVQVVEPEVQQQQEEPSQSAAQPVSSSGSSAYTAPQNLFSLDVPSSWQFSTDTNLIEDVIVDTYTAPDGNGFVQVIVDEVGNNMSAVVKGQVTLDYMKRLYNADLRVATDVTLDDGREKLEWWSDKGKISGTTYFDIRDNHLYLITVYTKEGFERDYRQIFTDVLASFTLS